MPTVYEQRVVWRPIMTSSRHETIQYRFEFRVSPAGKNKTNQYDIYLFLKVHLLPYNSSSLFPRRNSTLEQNYQHNETQLSRGVLGLLLNTPKYKNFANSASIGKHAPAAVGKYCVSTKLVKNVQNRFQSTTQ